MSSKTLLCTLSAIGFALAAPGVHGNQLADGGFESPAWAAGAFTTVTPGAEPTGFAWPVSSGDVDVANLPTNPFIDFPAYEGLQALDLNGTQRGSIYQDFVTTAGVTSSITFAYADNPVESGLSSASVAISDVASGSSLLSGVVSHSTSTNGPPASADWLTYAGTFVATGAGTDISCVSTWASDSPSGGILIDAVNVTAVPEPESLAMVTAGWTLLAFARRKRRG